MKKKLLWCMIAMAPYFCYTQNVGVGTTTPEMKLHIVNAGSGVFQLENTSILGPDVMTEMFFKTGAVYTGAIKSIGEPATATDARLGFFTRAGGLKSNLVERLSITNQGRIGIGTTNPTQILDIYGNENAIQITDTTGIDNIFRIHVGNVAANIRIDNLNSKDNSEIRFFVDGDKIMTVDSLGVQIDSSLQISGNVQIDGNVGIGTALPEASLHISDITSNGSPASIKISAKQGTPFDIDAASELIIDGFRGNVGANAGSIKFDLRGNNGAQISSRVGTNNSLTNGANLIFSTSPDATGMTERMRITNMGNVGIGTTTPAARLHVDSTAVIGDIIVGTESDSQATSNATGKGFLTTPWLYTNAIEAQGERGAQSTLITIGNDGNYGVDDEIHMVTNGTNKLTVKSTGVEIDGKAKVSMMDKENAADSVVVRLTDGTLAVRDVATLSDNAGWTMLADTIYTLKRNIGIGTKSPKASLHVDSIAVVGDINVGAESNFQGTSNNTGQGFLTTPWIYTNAIEAQGERGNVSTLITIGDDGNYGVADEIHLVTNGTNKLTAKSTGVEIVGKAKVSMMGKENAADSVVVRLTDGTLAVRDVATLSDNAGWTMLADTIYTLKRNIGIGTASPDASLHIADISNNSNPASLKISARPSEFDIDAASELIIDGFRGSTGADAGSIKFDLRGNNGAQISSRVGVINSITNGANLIFSTSPDASGMTERMRISNMGRVGIGTSLPLFKQHVSDTVVGASNFISEIQNRSNDDTDYSNGLRIKAGADIFNSSFQSKYIEFVTPNGNLQGEIIQESGGVSYGTTSDMRLKTAIKSTHYGLSELMQIEVKDYLYKSDLNTPQSGFLAQQLYKVYPFAVNQGGEDVKTEPWTVDYGKLTPLLVKAVQDQQAEIIELKSALAQQQLENENQNKELADLKKIAASFTSLSKRLALLEAGLTQIND